MARSENQKRKLLLLLDYLRAESDEDHPVTTQTLVSYLQERGVSAERKSVYADLTVLAEHGYDIRRLPGRSGGVYLGSREFELPELKLLVDAVQASRFITKKKSDALISKLEGLTSRHQATQLQRQVFVGGRVKSMNESAYYSVDAIHTAITRHRAVAFRYFDLDRNKEKVYRRGGAEYHVEPYCLVWDNAQYYLVGKPPEGEETRHYRVDKMDGVRVTDESAETPKSFDPGAYVGRYFSMFSGRAAKVRLACQEAAAGVILDRFGRDVMLVPKATGGFTVTLDVVVSPQFWGWLAALSGLAKPEAPEWVVEEYRAYLRGLLEEGGTV